MGDYVDDDDDDVDEFDWDLPKIRAISDEYEEAMDDGKIETYEEWEPFMTRMLAAFDGDWNSALENMSLFAQDGWIERFVKEHNTSEE